MGKNFIKKEKEEFYLHDTAIENIFINEYLPMAPAEYVKVYIFGYMYAEMDTPMDNSIIAGQMGLHEEDVLKAWTYWEERGIIRKHFFDKENKFEYGVEFVSLKDKIYGIQKKTAKKSKKSKEALVSDELKELYLEIEKITGRVIGGKEPLMILSWVEDLGASNELIAEAYKYCIEARKKDDPRYVQSLVQEWAGKGLLTKDAIENHLNEVDQRHYHQKRVMKALGFSRNATERERVLIDSWFEQMGYTLERVLEACGKTSGISNPNINYVDRVLKNWLKESGQELKTRPNGEVKAVKAITAADVKKYYDELNRRANQEAEERKAEIYARIPYIKNMDDGIKDLGMKVSKLILSRSADSRKQLENLKNRVQVLEMEKELALKEHNYPLDYMDVKYKCSKCGDTGTDDRGERCECYVQRLKEVETWQNS